MKHSSTRYLRFPNGKVWPVEPDKSVSAMIELPLAAAHRGLDAFLDEMSEAATGSPVIENISYEIVGFNGTTMKLVVTGNMGMMLDELGLAFDALQPSTGTREDDDSITEATFEQFGYGLDWLSVEIDHARQTIESGDEAGALVIEESVIKLANGREIRCPVYPEDCTYVRVLCMGYEMAYWVDDEWKDCPADVMGAFLGAAHAVD